MAIVLNALAVDGTTGELLGVETGTGSLVNGRDSARYAWSDEDLAYSVPAYEAAWNGGRPVENLFVFSEFSVGGNWSTDSDCTDNGDGTYTYTAQYGDIYLPIKRTIPVGSALIFSYEIEVLSGSTTAIWFRDASKTHDKELVFSGSNRCAVNTITSVGWGTTMSLQYRGASNFPTLRVNSIQLEDVTGRADTTTPSEYTSRNVAGSTGYAVYGTENGNSVADGVQGESELALPITTETNWVEGGGTNQWTWLAGTWTYDSSIGGVQYIKESAITITNGTTYRLHVHSDRSGIIRLFNSTASVAHMSAYKAINPGDNYFVFTSTVNDTGVRLYSNGSNNQDFTLSLISIKEYTAANNTRVVAEAVGTDLATVPRLSYSPAATNSLWPSNNLGGTGWSVEGTPIVTFDQPGLTGAPNTATYVEDDDISGFAGVRYLTLAVSAGTTTCVKLYVKKDTNTSYFPLFRISLNGGTAKVGEVSLNTQTVDTSITGADAANTSVYTEIVGDWISVTIQRVDTGANNNLAIRLYPAFSSTLGGSADLAAVRGFLIGNVEVYKTASIVDVRDLPPIFTPTAAISTTADDYTFNITNHSNTIGTYTCEWTPSYATSEVSGDLEIVSLTTAAGLLYYDGTAGNVESTDGTNTSTKAETITAGTTYDLEVAYSTGGDSLQATVDTVGGSAESYDGGFTTGTEIALFRNNAYANELFALTFDDGAGATSIPVFAHHYMHNIG